MRHGCAQLVRTSPETWASSHGDLTRQSHLRQMSLCPLSSPRRAGSRKIPPTEPTQVSRGSSLAILPLVFSSLRFKVLN